MCSNLAPRFEHRLLLSATPHNGHSNSFSALLEILDSQRFWRGVTVLKSHLGLQFIRVLAPKICRMGDEDNYSAHSCSLNVAVYRRGQEQSQFDVS